MEKVTAIVLAAGAGKRMHSAVRKQYMLLCGKPVLYYSLRAFQDCPFVDEIVLVIGQDEIDNDSFAIKDMDTSEQVTVPMAHIIDELVK